MIRFTDEMKDRINNAHSQKKTCLWATASKSGEPSISFRGSTYAFDDEHLAFWDRSHQYGWEHLEENPHVVMLYVDLSARTGWRFYGQATVYREGPTKAKIMERVPQVELDKDPERKGLAVLVRVDKIRRFSGDEVVQER